MIEEIQGEHTKGRFVMKMQVVPGNRFISYQPKAAWGKAICVKGSFSSLAR
jgi:hypothetical protein